MPFWLWPVYTFCFSDKLGSMPLDLFFLGLLILAGLAIGAISILVLYKLFKGQR